MSTVRSFKAPSTFIPFRKMVHRERSRTPTTNYPKCYEKTIFAGKNNKNKTQLQAQACGEIEKQNNKLREENRILRRQILGLKLLHQVEKYDKMACDDQKQQIGLRSTIKRETGELNHLRAKVNKMTRQMDIYEDIIKGLQHKISDLTCKNCDHSQKLQAEQQKQRIYREQKDLMALIQHKFNSVLGMYEQLKDRFEIQEQEWQEMKNKWQREKLDFPNVILTHTDRKTQQHKIQML